MTLSPTPLVCVNHPKTETHLRCAKCNDPICTRCARRTPTGYICPSCQKNLQKRFEEVVWYDYISAVLAALFAFIGGLLVPFLSGIFYGILLILYAPLISKITARTLQAIWRRHRGRRLYTTAIIFFVLGGIPLLLPYFESIYFALSNELDLQFIFYALWGLGYECAYIIWGAISLHRYLKGMTFLV